MTCCDRRLHLGLTGSVCPVCLAAIPAERCAEGDTVYLKKTCPEHGTTSTPVWRGLDSYLRWGQAPRAFSQPPVCATAVERGCPYDCGLCPDHRQQSCCVLLEVTSRCDLACPVCYASASRQGADASLAEIGGWLDTLVASAGGRVHIQLSGGEPTVRDDLAEIVALIRARGFEFVQLNTNGVRIAREPDYLAALAKAGLDCVFLQFDGVSDDVYQRLRGAKLMRLKTQAIRNCGQAGIGVVLTPTLVPGVNVDQIGAIVDFAIAETPAVRAVHFQPVSYFGRCLTPPENASRITLPEVMEALIAHSGGAIQHGDFHPGSAENPYCSFSGRFVIGEGGRLRATGEEPQSCCGVPVKEESSACCGVPAKQESEACCSASTDRDSGELLRCPGQGREPGLLRSSGQAGERELLRQPGQARESSVLRPGAAKRRGGPGTPLRGRPVDAPGSPHPRRGRARRFRCVPR